MDQPTPAQGAPDMVVPGSLFQPGRNCLKLARARRAALLVDGDAYFSTFMKAAERAQRSIVIVGWDFDSRTRLTWDKSVRGMPVILGDFLNFLARRRRGLHIHILDWDFPMVFGMDREFPPLYGTGWKQHRRVEMRYDNTHPTTGCHHQKIVVIDDALAFSGGLDLTWRRWDTCAHGANDPRRVADGKPYAPFHDVMLAVDGEAAQVLAGIVRDRWQAATGKALPAVSVKEDPWPDKLEPDFRDVDIAISRTMPGTEERPEVREVEALFLDMIARAKNRIYIENQYFTSHKVGEALAARLAQPDSPEIVLVSRLLSHGWLAEATMHALRTRLVRMMHQADHRGRFQIYYPHIPELADGTCVDVHSKVMIVDDEWLRVGSANICNRSMGMDTECDVTLSANGRPEVARTIRDSRNRLIGEHLGVEAARVHEEIERRGSMQAAIEALRGDGRALLPMDKLDEWPDAVVSIAEITDPERPISIDQLVNEFALDDGTEKRGSPWVKALVAVAVCLALVALWRYTPLAALASPERIIAWAEDFASRPWAPFVVLAAYTPASFTLFPRPLITLFAVVAFGPWLGVAYAMTGILLAASSNYIVGTLMGRATVRRFAGTRLNRVSEVLRSKGLLAMTAVRLVPIAPFVVVGLVAGAIRIRFAHFAAGTAIGILPGSIVTTIFGDQLASALIDPAQINYALIAAVAAAFVVGIYAVRRWLWKTQLAGHFAEPSPPSPAQAALNRS
jgi:phospholipase D1/2